MNPSYDILGPLGRFYNDPCVSEVVLKELGQINLKALIRHNPSFRKKYNVSNKPSYNILGRLRRFYNESCVSGVVLKELGKNSKFSVKS